MLRETSQQGIVGRQCTHDSTIQRHATNTVELNFMPGQFSKADDINYKNITVNELFTTTYESGRAAFSFINAGKKYQIKDILH